MKKYLLDFYFFGSNDCPKCKKYIKLAKKLCETYNLNYVFINGDEDDDGIQAFCDEHNVEKYPHIKIYNKDKLVFEDIDTINCPKMVFSILKEISYETESETNRSNKS